MKKKGFTLIELLAVIVILAIIALIATPLVLKYIEKSRKESKVDSAYSFVRNLETEIANYSIKHNGKKYNGQPTDKGYYELTSFENSEIDTTVKGDKPNSIKVCLSSLGQVDKAMFEYGKYYVSYDGKKGSISDRDTYDKFSCSGNVAGGSGSATVGGYIIDADLQFAYDDSYKAYTATLKVTKDISDKFKEGFDYDIIIDNGKTELLYLCDSLDPGLIFVTHAFDLIKMKQILVNEEELLFVVMEEFTGSHNIKIGNPRTIEENLYFAIDDDGDIKIIGTDLGVGEASIVIKDNDDTPYFNQKVELEEYFSGDLIGADSDCRKNMPQLSDVFTALTNGKTITVEVTQGGNVFTVSKDLESMMHIDTGGYFSRYLVSFGC